VTIPHRNILVIVNPAAGPRDQGARDAFLRARSSDREPRVEVRYTSGPGHARRLAGAAEAQGFDLVAVAGGDGTVMEAASGIVDAGSRLTLAQLPVGTGNLLAGALGVPQDLEQAWDLLYAGEVQSFDLGYLPDHDRHFGMLAGAGYDARIVDAPREMKARFGFQAYLWTAFTGLFRIPETTIDLELDGRGQRVRGHTVMVVNVGQVHREGLRLGLGPAVTPHDGLFHVIVLRSRSAVGALKIARRVVAQKIGPGSREISVFEARRVSVDTERKLPTEVDGETLGQTPFRAEVARNAARLWVPEGYRPPTPTPTPTPPADTASAAG